MFLPAVIAVSMYFDKRRAFATGVAVCGAGVGCFIFAPLGNYMLQILDWKNAMMVIACITAQGAVFGALFTPLPDSQSKLDNNNLETRLPSPYDSWVFHHFFILFHIVFYQHTLFVRINLVKYWPIFKRISLSKSGDFVIILSQKIPSHLKSVAALPCEF